MKSLSSLLIFCLAILSAHAQQPHSTSYNIGYQVGYFIGAFFPFIILALISYGFYRYFNKKKS